LPFEKRVDVAGAQTKTIDVQLIALTAGGRLRVAEQTGKPLEVVVDNAPVGKTPWEGLIAPGDHMVLLRGEGNFGTQPVLASVKLNQVASLNLLAEQLDASVRVQPTPASATVIVDGIPVGRGTWEGRLRPGAHVIEATAEGYIAFKADLNLKKDASESIAMTLDRDPTVFAERSASLGLELDAALPIGAVFGGDLSSGCSGSCSAGLPLGVRGALHGIYQASSGFGGGIDVGYLLAFRTISGRDAAVQPVGGLAPNKGTAEDKLRFGGLTVGGSAQYRRGEEWPVLLRVGLGALFASASDTRSGEFTNSFKDSYTANARETATGTYLYVAPELRLGRRFGKHFELNVGVELLLATALSQPRWKDEKSLTTTNYVAQCPPAPASCMTEQRRAQGDGSGAFGRDSLAGSLMLFVAPGLGARYDF